MKTYLHENLDISLSELFNRVLPRTPQPPLYIVHAELFLKIQHLMISIRVLIAHHRGNIHTVDPEIHSPLPLLYFSYSWLAMHIDNAKHHLPIPGCAIRHFGKDIEQRAVLMAIKIRQHDDIVQRTESRDVEPIHFAENRE